MLTKIVNDKVFLFCDFLFKDVHSFLLFVIQAFSPAVFITSYKQYERKRAVVKPLSFYKCFLSKLEPVLECLKFAE